jgi:hypothetical protein
MSQPTDPEKKQEPVDVNEPDSDDASSDDTINALINEGANWYNFFRFRRYQYSNRDRVSVVV